MSWSRSCVSSRVQRILCQAVQIALADQVESRPDGRYIALIVGVELNPGQDEGHERAE